MISLDKRNASCNLVFDLSTKTCFSYKTRNVNDKVFTNIARKNEVKTLVKHNACDYKFKCDSTTCNSNQKWSNDVESIAHTKKIIARILAYVFLKIVVLKSVANDSVTVCYEVISMAVNVSTNVTNNTSTNVYVLCQ